MLLTTIEYGGHTWGVEMKVVHAEERGWMRFSFIRTGPDGEEIRLVSSVDPMLFSADPDRGTRLTEDWLRERLAQVLEESPTAGAGRPDRPAGNATAEGCGMAKPEAGACASPTRTSSSGSKPSTAGCE